MQEAQPTSGRSISPATSFLHCSTRVDEAALGVFGVFWLIPFSFRLVFPLPRSGLSALTTRNPRGPLDRGGLTRSYCDILVEPLETSDIARGVPRNPVRPRDEPAAATFAGSSRLLGITTGPDAGTGIDISCGGGKDMNSFASWNGM
jgi:hypothetical protein